MGAVPSRFAVFDLETTGPDPEADAIVTAYVGVYDTAADRMVEEWDWLLEPRVPIADGAAAVHGISDGFAREWGIDAALGVFGIEQRLDILARQGLPIAGYNLRFDFTMLDRETRRHYPGMRPFEPGIVLDGFVIDKHLNPYRKGKRTLGVVCAAYGIPVFNAHDAGADCLMAARLVRYQLSHPRLSVLSLRGVHEAQVNWAADQARGLAAYFAKTEGKQHLAGTVQGEWPLVPYRELVDAR